VSRQVLHLDFISLSPATGLQDREQLIEAAGALAAIGGIIATGIVEGEPGSDFGLAFYFVLDDFAALEPFGTDPRYSRFLQGEVAPRLKAFAGADVRLDDDFAAAAGRGAVIAVMAPDETYDWEVREALDTWAGATGATIAVVGLAVGERQAYRGVALAFGADLHDAPAPDPQRFRASVLRGATRQLA
jgi:hypothetical protein